MKDGVPIGFVDSEQSPEIAEIATAIKEADEWISLDQSTIDEMKLRMEVEQDMIDYATEYNLTQPDVSITSLQDNLAKAEQNLQKDLSLREDLIKLQNDFHHLDWRQNLQEIRNQHYMRDDNFPKPVD